MNLTAFAPVHDDAGDAGDGSGVDALGVEALRPAYCAIAAPVAAALAVAAAAVAIGDDALPVEVVRPALVVTWSVAGLVLALRRRQDRLAPIVMAGAVLGGAGSLAAAVIEHRSLDGAIAVTWDLVLRLCTALLPAVALHLLLGLADGRLRTPARRRAVIAGYAVGLVAGLVAMAERDHLPTLPLVAMWAVAVGAGLAGANVRYVSAGAIERRRMQWIGWGIAVTAEASIIVAALGLLVDWPHHAGAVTLALTVPVPLALTLGTSPAMVARVDRLLTHTVSIAGVTGLVVVVYLVVVIGLGQSPTDAERGLLLLSMTAAALCALLYLPARRWLTERANRLVYGERVSPDQLLRTFGQRLTRAITMDELLLQLVESLRKSMVLASAEVWTGQDGHFELAAGVPHRSVEPIVIEPRDAAVVARAGVSGGTWLDVWLPALAGSTAAGPTRVAPVAHAGELLGLIVASRGRDGEPFTEAEDNVLTELARQVALALHNVQLDAALQASLDELQVRNDQLQRSRARIVAAGDEERRRIERNLHDGAQQHLVALAVKLRLARDVVEDDPNDAMSMIDEVRENLQEAIVELRALAHGIFPPLLMSGGLAEALRAAAARAALPATVEMDRIGRYDAEIEAAVYFCVLEALQNAGKYAGDGAKATVSVAECDEVLAFEVADDGAGFEASDSLRHGEHGHGFVNMADRLGAFGGTLDVRSAPGAGTTISGSLPLQRR